VQATITSSSNKRIKYVRSLSRRNVRYSEQHFVIEGVRLLDEALRAGIVPALVLYTRSFTARSDASALLEQLDVMGASGELVDARLMNLMTSTVTPQGILAVVPFPQLPAPENPGLILIVDHIATPGNLGTLLRSAEAAGVDLALLSIGSTDPFGPKVVRGGMGVHFRLPLRVGLDWSQLGEQVEGRPVYLAEAGAPRAYHEVDWGQPSALIVGSEAHGPSAGARELMTEAIQIPMHGRTESLNAGVAGSVILFEAARQRRLAAER